VRVLTIVHDSDAGPGVFAEVIRARGVEWHSWRLPEEGPPWCDPRDYDAVLSFGSAVHPDQEDDYPWVAEERQLLADLIEQGVPLLGVCLGAQLVAAAAGARVRRAAQPEIGWYDVDVAARASHDPLIAPLAPRFDALEWHSYEFALPPDATALASSANCLQAFRVGELAWGIQFHAEVTLEDFESWLRDYGRHGDALRLDLDPERLRDQTRAQIASWNELGRGLCERFLRIAATRRRSDRRAAPSV
jgi:GMP synthase-like glutamine amidotransferase